MKALEPREREFKRVNRDEPAGRRNSGPGEFWDGVAGVYTVRARTTQPGETAAVPRAGDDVVGVMCEPTN